MSDHKLCRFDEYRLLDQAHGMRSSSRPPNLMNSCRTTGDHRIVIDITTDSVVWEGSACCMHASRAIAMSQWIQEQTS